MHLAQVENNLNIHFKEINQQKAVVDFYRFCDFLEKENIPWNNGTPNFTEYIKRSGNKKLTQRTMLNRYRKLVKNYMDLNHAYWSGLL